MSQKSRIKLLNELKEIRKSDLIITYITSIRSGYDFHMAMDQIRYIYDHLLELNLKKKDTVIDVFLCSNGGDGLAPWKLVTLLREYCEKLNVIIPFRAFSAATLFALGANEIIMHPMGMLGPTDPTVGNQYNPIDAKTNKQIGISVEDLYAYIALIKDDVGITHDDEVIQAFNILADKVHPFALGNAKRQNSQSKMLATKLLELHMNKVDQMHIIKEIVDNLTSKLFFHGHPINRNEAKDLSLKIKLPRDEEEKTIWELYLEYEDYLKMNIPYNPVEIFVKKYPTLAPKKTENVLVTNLIGVIIESMYYTDIYEETHRIFGEKKPEGIYNILSVSSEKKGWRRIKVR